MEQKYEEDIPRLLHENSLRVWYKEEPESNVIIPFKSYEKSLSSVPNEVTEHIMAASPKIIVGSKSITIDMPIMTFKFHSRCIDIFFLSFPNQTKFAPTYIFLIL